MEGYYETTFYYLRTVYDYYDKIAANGEGHKPDLNRQKYVAESELALLSILYKLIIMIYFFHSIAVNNTDGSRNNKRLTFSNTKSHCANVTRFANATLHHYSESSEHSQNSL